VLDNICMIMALDRDGKWWRILMEFSVEEMRSLLTSRTKTGKMDTKLTILTKVFSKLKCPCLD
jgi:hypothetical protein